MRAFAFLRCALSLESAATDDPGDHWASHLDWVQIGTVGRQEEEPRAALFEDGLGFFAFVAGEVVEDHHVAALKRWSQLGLNIFLEDFAVHGAVNDPRCGQAIMAQGGDKRLRSPVTEGRFHLQSLPPARTSAQARHLRRCSRLVDKDQPFRALLHPRLAVRRPHAPCPNHVSAIGFARQQRFF